jgi:tetratricopeptide (TPR) repeat protein
LNLAGIQDRIARIYIRQGKIDEALTEYQKALALSEPLSGGAEPNLEALYTVVNVFYGMGEVHVARARKPGTQEKRIQSWKQARGWYQKSRAAFLRIPGWLPITPNEFDSRTSAQIEAQVSLCQSVLGRAASEDKSAVSLQ